MHSDSHKAQPNKNQKRITFENLGLIALFQGVTSETKAEQGVNEWAKSEIKTTAMQRVGEMAFNEKFTGSERYRPDAKSDKARTS